MKHRSAEALEQGLQRYRDLLHRYHRTLDLISDSGLESLAAKFDDALAYARAAEAAVAEAAPRLLDVGSGAGLPGVIIALALPNFRVVLVERRQKRSAFLRLCLGQLALANAEVHQADVRDLALEPVHAVTAQAVSTFAAMYGLTHHLHARSVTMLSRKGPAWQDEIAALEARFDATIDAKVVAELQSRGRLVQVRMPGGLTCPS